MTESAQSCGCDKGANWTCEQHRRDPLDDASSNLRGEISALHDLVRAAKREKNQQRQSDIFCRVVELEGFLKALVIDARSGLDALKDIPL